MEFDGIYPMVKSHNYGKSQFTIFLEGKIDYKWPFSINMLNYQSLHPSNSKRTSIPPARLRCNLYSKHISLSFPRPFVIIYSRGSTVRTPIFNEELSPGCLTSSLS